MARREPKSLFRRLTNLFRSGPVVKRKIRGLDTTLAVADKTKSSGTLLFQKSLSPTYATITSNAYNLSERLMRYQDFQEMEYTPEIAAALDIYADETCLSGDTIIPLLDGSRPTVLELFQEDKQQFWVYSYDVVSNAVVPGLATRVIKTGSKRVFRVTLDDGTSLRLTDNHLVLLSNGEYARVHQLCVGSSLRSLHTKVSTKSLGDYIDGYSTWSDFLSRTNHRVMSIVEEGIEDVFDLEVLKWHNFAATATPESTSFVFVHNCAQDDRGRVLHVHSDNEKVKEVLEDLFYNTLNVEFNLRSWARNLVKYGDFFLYNDVSPEYGVVNAFPIPVNEIEREENYDRDDPFAVRYRWVTLGNRTLENWEVTHFRLLGNDMFLPYGSSIIEPARRIWRQLILIEDAMLVYRVVRAPERRVFYIDVANVPPENVPMYVEEQRRNLRTNQVVDNQSGRVDLRYNPLPVHKDTPIPLLDGTMMTIEALSRKMNEEVGWVPWVYSVQDKTQKLVPGKVVWCGKNYTATTLTKIWLDDGSYVTTAPEHPFVMRDGSTKRADELLVGDSLMSAYRDLNNRGYERIIEPSGDRVSTHVMVARDVYAEKWSMTDQPVVHHKHPEQKEKNKRNNSPDNLEVMNFWEHKKMHAEHCELTLNTPERLAVRAVQMAEYNKSEQHRARTIEINKRDRKAERMGEAYNGTDLHKAHNENRRQGQRKSWDANKAKRSEAMQWIIPNEVIGFAFEVIKANPKIGREELTSAIRNDASICSLLKQANAHNNRSLLQFHVNAIVSKLVRTKCIPVSSYRTFRQFALNNSPPVNHQVVNVETLENVSDDVYCMTVVGPNHEDDRHNFAVNGLGGEIPDNQLKSLVFVRNSVDEDYFIPVRGSDTGTRIDTLAGGQNTAAVEDVAYIQKKLFAALKIPRAYLGYDEMLSCFVPETRVDLLDGRSLSIEQIKHELDVGRTVWVYSVDPETQQMKPGRVVWAGPTRADAELVRVTLDNGESFDCTPDHKWMLRDGTWCQAGDLQPAVSLMPLYKRYRSLNGGSEYEQVFDPASSRWVWTHKMVTMHVDVEAHESVMSEDKHVVHHRDVNRFNNNPENLVRMGFAAHREHHASHLSAVRTRALKEGKYNDLNNGWARTCRDRVKHLWSMQQLITWCQHNRPSSKRAIVDGYGLSETQLHVLLSENSMTYAMFADNYVSGGYKLDRLANMGTHSHAKHVRRCGIGMGGRGAATEARECVACKSPFQTYARSPKKFCTPECCLGFPQAAKVAPKARVIASGALNHHVVSVVPLTERRQTWCMEVAGVHTFGLSKGVIVSNSKATLAQEDIRFSRTINVIQKTMLAELNKLAIIHLYAHGYDGDDLQNFTLRLSNPSTVAQQQKLELWRAKFEIGGSLPEGMGSAEFVQREIWGLTQEQIDVINKQQESEARRKASVEAAAAGDSGDVGGGGGSAEDLFGGGGEEAGGEEAGGDEEMPPPETAGEEPEEETEYGVKLLTSSDDQEDGEDFTLKLAAEDDATPVRPKNQVQKDYEYNRARRRTHGASKTHMPDFVKMTGNDNDAMKDPTDSEWMRSVVSNPFGEARERKLPFGGMPPDLWSTLSRMTTTLKITRQNAVIAEGDDGKPLGQLIGRDVQDEIDMGQNIDEAVTGSLDVATDLSEILIIDDEDDESFDGSDE